MTILMEITLITFHW